ncbi:MAG: gamma-glutamylcyclotransferase [Leptolyngbyaceae cyanobacterium]
MFYYFAYGSCMCPVDLKRSLGESTHPYVIGPAYLNGYRLGFYHRSQKRNCGALDIVRDGTSVVHGVLYQLPDHLAPRLDDREGVHMGCYRRETIQVECQGRYYDDVQTYSVVDKLPVELAPNDWYFEVVMRGAVVCGLPESYCWKLFDHMCRLQTQPEPPDHLPLVS